MTTLLEAAKALLDYTDSHYENGFRLAPGWFEHIEAIRAAVTEATKGNQK